VLYRWPCGRVVYGSSGVNCDTGDVAWYLPYVVPAGYPEAEEYGDETPSDRSLYPVCSEVGIVLGLAVSCDATA